MVDVKTMDEMLELDTIYNEDCLEGMKQIPDGTIDAVICDLPYWTTANKWDSVIPFDKLWAEYKRIIKRGAPIVLFAQCPFDKVLGCSNIEWLKYEWIWMKEQGTGGLNSNHQPLKEHENILVFSEFSASPTGQPMTYNPQFEAGKPYKIKREPKSSDNYNVAAGGTFYNEGKRYPTSIIHFKRDEDGFHPTQKPVDLLRYLVLTYTNEGDTVLDNCMGSGTTAIACIKERRHFIGFELSKEYFDKAVRRIKAEQAQLTLF